MKVGNKVIVDMPNRYLRERFYWQPFEIREIREQATGMIVRLRGLCCPEMEITGDPLDSLIPYVEL